VPTKKSGMKNSENLRLCLLELEPHHPVGQIAGRHLCCRTGCGMQLEQATASITDDPTGVVGPGDDLERAGERLVGDGVQLSWIRRRDRRLQLSTALCIWRPCPFDALHRERSAPVRISGRTVSASVVTVQILCKSLTDTSPSRCPTGHTRIGEGDLLPA
jgi:hypothetical protein